TAVEIWGHQASAYGMTSPVPYLPAAILARLAGLSDVTMDPALAHRLIVVRLSSVVLGAAMVFVVARLAEKLFPDRRALAWALAIFAALHPELVFVHSYVNADAYTSLMAALQVELWFDLVHRQMDRGLALRQGVVAGLLLLGKSNGWLLLPLTAVV